MKKFALIVEKSWNVETRGVYPCGLLLRGIKIEKYRGWYLFGFIPLFIKQFETEYHGQP
jgi:hypothetical protein